MFQCDAPYCGRQIFTKSVSNQRRGFVSRVGYTPSFKVMQDIILYACVKKLNGLLILHTDLVFCVSPDAFFFFEATEKDGVKNC